MTVTGDIEGEEEDDDDDDNNENNEDAGVPLPLSEEESGGHGAVKGVYI